MDRINIGMFVLFYGLCLFFEKNLSELMIRCLKFRKCENLGYDGDFGNDW